MSKINLSKGGKVNLSKASNGSTKFEARLRWSANSFDGSDFDLDAMTLLCDSNLKVINPQGGNFIFYSNLESPCKGVVHSGDNITGGSENAPDEVITFDFSKMNSNTHTLPILINIHDAESRRQNFGMTRDSHIEIYDIENDKIICEYYLEDEFSQETCVVIGEFRKRGEDWIFSAVGQGKKDGLVGVLSVYGIEATY